MPDAAVPERPSRWDRKKQITRDALHEAALQLVEERGLSQVTLEEITDLADVAPRTFFNYFACKEDAVIGRAPDFTGQLLAAWGERPADEPVFDSLCAVLLDSLVARAVDRDVFLRRIRVIKSEPELRARMAAQLEHFQRALITEVARRTGVDPARELEPSLLVSTVLAAYRAALMHWCDRPDEGPLEIVMGEAFGRLGAGLRPTPAVPSAGVGT